MYRRSSPCQRKPRPTRGTPNRLVRAPAVLVRADRIRAGRTRTDPCRPARLGVPIIGLTMMAGCSVSPHVLPPGAGSPSTRAVAVYALHLASEGRADAVVRAWRGRPIFADLEGETIRHGGRGSRAAGWGEPVAIAFGPGRLRLALAEVSGIPVGRGGGAVEAVVRSDRPALLYLGDLYVRVVETGFERVEGPDREALPLGPAPIGPARAPTRRPYAVLDVAVVDDPGGMRERLERLRPRLWAAFGRLESSARAWRRGGASGWEIPLGRPRPLRVLSSPPAWANEIPEKPEQ